MNERGVVIQATVNRETQKRLSDDAWKARTSVSAYVAAIIGAHYEVEEAVPQPPTSNQKPEIIQKLAALGYGPEDVGKLSWDDASRIVAQQIRRRA
jgi:hypothetical protein